MSNEDEARIKAYMAAKMAHIKMYNECMNLVDGLDVEKFAELVRAGEREKVAQWMMDKGYATGHGDSIEDLLKEAEWQVAERERNACAKVVEQYTGAWDDEGYALTQAIRARGDDLQTAIERGTKAWADVPDATEWVEELRGNVDAVNMSQDRVDETAKGKYKACYEIPDWRPGMVVPAPKREWVGLTDEEIKKIAKKHKWYDGNVEPHLMPVFRSLEAKLREKNGG